jgi:hypothetical protein
MRMIPFGESPKIAAASWDFVSIRPSRVGNWTCRPDRRRPARFAVAKYLDLLTPSGESARITW